MAKSPVYGLGRNWKHRPKRKSKFAPSAANIKMKGKKEKQMSCGCCVCLDLRDKMMRKVFEDEIKNSN